MPDYHIILLPRENYWGWVNAVRKYAVRFQASITPDPLNALNFHRPRQVVTIAVVPGAYPQQGDIVAWFKSQASDVELDILEVGTPDQLRSLLTKRIESGLRFGPEEKPPEPQPKTGFQLLWPVDSPRITQRFGMNPDLYRRFGLPGHEGIDFHAPMNSNVYACADGVVYRVHDGSGGDPYGIHVRIRHADGYSTIYAHLNQALVHTSQTVKAGDLIGLADSTGNSSGSHLHLTLKKEGATASGLTTFPRDIMDPTPFLVPPGEKKPPAVADWPYGRCLVGLHGRADGPMQEADWQVVRSARIEALKLTSSASPRDVDIAKQIKPDIFVMVRLFADFRNRVVPALDFARWVEYDMGNFYEKGVRYFEVHNEPNLTPEGYGLSWKSGREFGEWFIQVMGVLKAKFPEARFGWPGLSPGPTIPGMRHDNHAFLESAGSLVGYADWIACHCYWQNETAILSPEGGLGYRFYREEWPDKLLFITEFSNPTPGLDPATKGRQYLKYYQQLRNQPGIGAAFSFVVSASTSFPHEIWRDENGLLTPIAGIVGSRSF